MSYTTKLCGEISLDPPVSQTHAAVLRGESQRWPTWALSDDRSAIIPVNAETRTDFATELKTLISERLAPWGYDADGNIDWQGEDPTDSGCIWVEDNEVSLVPVTEVAPSGPATEQLLQELTSDNDDKARAAVSAISYFSQYGNFDTAVAVPQLMSLLGDNRMVVRFRAASCLAFLRTAAEPAISKLVGALNDEHEWVRSAAAEALGEIGAPAAEAIPHLERLSNDVSYGPRGRAVEALQKIRRK